VHDHADAAPIPPGPDPGEAGPPRESGRPCDAGALLAAAYGDLCALAVDLMRHERPGHALHPTGLVHEAAIRILRPDALPALRDRGWFFGVMATTMRRVLVEHARARAALRRGGGRRRVSLSVVADADAGGPGGAPDAGHVALADMLRQLGAVSRRQSDVVTLRFFDGLDTHQVARRLGVSVSTVERDWRAARAWLRERLDDRPGEGPPRAPPGATTSRPDPALLGAQPPSGAWATH
jgi:RNA polymerase sigma-70 factor, ECF subfamily